MTKRVVFYDKGISGHRLPIQTLIKQRLKPNHYSFDVVVNSGPENTFAFLRELAQRAAFDHCHLLTLRDCVEDCAAAPDEFRWLQRTGVSLSGTYYRFTHFSPHLETTKALRRYPYLAAYGLFKHGLPMHPSAARQFRPLARIMQSDALKAVTIPDERLTDRLRYPLWRSKLRYLPDPATFCNEPSSRDIAKKDFGWDDGLPTILMFGSMKDWKGLDTLVKALAEGYSHVYPIAFRVVLAGQQVQKRPAIGLSPTVELVEFDHYIDDDMAKQVFAASDCVVMPYKKSFEWSSGTFSLACASGKFVIVPDSGVMAWRVRKLNNGLVYRADRPSSLAEALSRFVRTYPSISYPIEGSVEYAATCAPDRYLGILNQIITDSMSHPR